MLHMNVDGFHERINGPAFMPIGENRLKMTFREGWDSVFGNQGGFHEF